MTAFNLTSINSSGGILTFTQGVNDVLLGGWMGAMLLIGITIIVFTSVMFTTNDPKKAMIVASFGAFSLSIPLVALGLLHNLGIYISLVLLGLTLAASRNKD